MENYEIKSLDVNDNATSTRFDDSISNNNNNNNADNTIGQQQFDQNYIDNQQQQQQQSYQTRTIYINQLNQSIQIVSKFCSNSISTSKYNVFTFLPKFLFEQFSKYSNIFFFMIVMLQVSFITYIVFV
jgi:hypothetical protein